MASDAALHDGDAPRPVPRGRLRARRAAKWTGIGVLGLVALIGLFFLWLNSELGHRYVVRQINNLEMASGLDIDVGRIEGSLFGELKLYDLRLKDPKGLFFVAPEATLDWRPLAYFRNHIDIRELQIPRARLMRLPELRPGDPNAPLLPDIDIDISRFEVERILVDQSVTGYRHLLGLGGSAKISDGRAQVALDAGAINAPGFPGGDKLVLRLDAVPEANRLDLGLRIEAPRGGFVAGVTGLNQPLSALVTGGGTWANWNGRARAALGGKGFANVAIGARDGTISLNGPVNPGLMMADGPLRRLLSPHVQLNLTTALADRRADTRLRLNSKAISVAAEGLIDLGQSRFENLKVAARLLRPGDVMPNITGRDLQLSAVLNGAFATPVVTYDLRAAALGFSGTVVEGLQSRGRAQINADRIVLPVSATARRITGLDPSLGGLLTNIRLDGTFFFSGTKVVSDNLRIRSDRLNATVVLAGDMAKGDYRAGITGTVNNYRIDGVGLLDITTDLDVFSSPAGFGLSGRVAVRTKRIDNASARDFLGGNASISAGVTYTPAGVITLDNIKLNAPLLRITSGRGTLWPDGRIDIRVAGVSNAYGPLAVVITGTTTAPQVQLRAASPGFGIGLRDVTATIRATAGGYAIQARGQSAYGPFEADVTILSGRGPLTIDIRRLVFAGMTFTGRVTQTPAGPFVGTLTMVGQGLEGTVQLGAEGRHQRVAVNATANDAQIPGETPVLIQRGIIQAVAILYPDAPHIVGDAQLAGVRSNNFSLARGRARIDYRGGRGLAQLFAEGTSGVPFRVGANVALAPDLIRAAAQGQVNRIPFRLARPAEIRKAGTDWVLSPTQLVLPQGNVLLAGRYGNGLVIQSRMRDFDLALLNAFSPGLGLGGKVSGSLDFAQPNGATFPRADARLNIAGFTRTGIAVRSPPVDIALAGELRPEGGALNAVIRREAAVIGRAQVRLQPVSSGASWMDRLLAAPLAGGIRYNGPAEVLWSFAGMADQQLSGPIGVAADFTGRVQSPQLAGIIRANNLAFADETYGTRIRNIALQGRFTSSTLEITQLTGRAGEGTISGRGTVGFAAAAGYPMDIRLNLQNAQLARSDNIGATLTGDLAITNSRANGALIAGDLTLPEVRYQIIRQGAAQVVELAGVRRKGEPLRPANEATAQADNAAPSIWKLDLRLHADNQLFIAGMGLESEWGADLRVQGTTATPSIVGTADLIRGTLSFSGQRFEVTRGHIAFTGARPPNPRLDLVASADIKDVTVNINISGSANNPQIAFTSNPGLPQDEIMARILFGGSVTEISALQAVQLATSLNSLRGGGGGLNPLGKLRSAGGFDRLRILGADDTTGRGTAIAAGFYLSNDIYLEIITDARGFTATQLEVALTKALSLLSQVGTSGGGNNVNLRYRKQY
jgi:translocation and assembly module TamB